MEEHGEEHLDEWGLCRAEEQSYETREGHIFFGCSLSPDKRLRFVEAKTKLTAKASQPILPITYTIGDSMGVVKDKISIMAERLVAAGSVLYEDWCDVTKFYLALVSDHIHNISRSSATTGIRNLVNDFTPTSCTCDFKRRNYEACCCPKQT
jgi:hypothetical protein